MLQLDVYSFSYHRSAERRSTLEHGGGYEFDCRCLYNPGREERFKYATGLDGSVASLLESDQVCQTFLQGTLGLVELSVNQYLARGLTYLAVGYGCTGGQHRSVFCANRCAGVFSVRGNVRVSLSHKQWESFDWLKDRGKV